MNEWLTELLAALPQQLILIPCLAFLESCVFIGLFVSGIFLLSAASLIYAQGETQLWLLIGLAFSGALVGDHAGFLFGKIAGPYLTKKRWVRKQLIKRKKPYRKFRAMLNKSLPWAICLGRLYPGTRSISPVVAGASGIKLGQFMLYDLLACTLWASGLALLVTGIDLL